MTKEQAYAVLELTNPNITYNEFKKIAREQRKRWHPDNNPDRDTTAKFQQVQEAIAVLDDYIKSGGQFAGEASSRAEGSHARYSGNTDHYQDQSAQERYEQERYERQKEAWEAERRAAEEWARRDEERRRAAAEEERRRDHSQDKFTLLEYLRKCIQTGLFAKTLLFLFYSLGTILDLMETMIQGIGHIPQAATVMTGTMLAIISFCIAWRVAKKVYRNTGRIIVSILAFFITNELIDLGLKLVGFLTKSLDNTVVCLITFLLVLLYEKRNFKIIRHYRKDNPYPPEKHIATLLWTEYCLVFGVEAVFILLSFFIH